MNRREMLKTTAAAGAITMVPASLLACSDAPPAASDELEAEIEELAQYYARRTSSDELGAEIEELAQYYASSPACSIRVSGFCSAAGNPHIPMIQCAVAGPHHAQKDRGWAVRGINTAGDKVDLADVCHRVAVRLDLIPKYLDVVEAVGSWQHIVGDNETSLGHMGSPVFRADAMDVRRPVAKPIAATFILATVTHIWFQWRKLARSFAIPPVPNVVEGYVTPLRVAHWQVDGDVCFSAWNAGVCRAKNYPDIREAIMTPPLLS